MLSLCRWLLPLLFVFGCSKNPEKALEFTWQEFSGRDEIISYGHHVRRPVYHAKVPQGWVRIDPLETDSLIDTKKSIVTFKIGESTTLTVHTFPTESLEERVSPVLQIERWRQQINDPKSLIGAVHYGGFAGLYFEGKNDEIQVFAWSMQLDIEHYQTLRYLAHTVEEEEHYKQMSADYTIKVVGPIETADCHREEISLFAESFELIQEIPIRI